MAYDRRNPIYAVGKRAYNMAVSANLRGSRFTNRYNRIMNVAGRMQEAMKQSAKGNIGG